MFYIKIQRKTKLPMKTGRQQISDCGKIFIREMRKTIAFRKGIFGLERTQKNRETRGFTAKKHFAKSYTYLQTFFQKKARKKSKMKNRICHIPRLGIAEFCP